MNQLDRIPGIPLPVYSTAFAIQIEVCYSRRDILASCDPSDDRSLADFTPVEFTLLSADQQLPRDGSCFALAASVPAHALHIGAAKEKAEGMIDVIIPKLAYSTFGRRRFIAAPLPNNPKSCWEMILRPLKDAKIAQSLLATTDDARTHTRTHD